MSRIQERSERSLRVLRLVVLGVLALTLLSAGHSYLTYDSIEGTTEPVEPLARGGTGAETQTAPAVVAVIDGVGPGQLVAYDDDGDVVYQNDSLFLYHDVDPSPRGAHTVTYVASEKADSDECAGERCLRNVIDRVNLTTDEVTRLHSWVDSRNGSTQTHDVDRVNASTYLVADISYPDRIYMVNTTTGEEIWEWRASEAYEPESGGDYPSDWTHLNDVEYLADGRVMANLRNQDQVVFIEPGSGIQSNWTLGSDDEHETLFEPHNPDYIPESRGGPAVVIADSENNRLVEYQRVNGSWERSWHWQDTTMQWPRDADRLPSGRTLVADSHGQRLLSVAQDGTIAWSRSFAPGSYDVELLGTGDESTGGTSATTLNLRSRWPRSRLADGNTSMRGAVGGGRTVSARESGETTSATTNPVPNDSTAAGSVGSPTRTASPAGSEPATDGGGLTLSTLVYGVVSLVPPLVLHGLLYTLPPWANAVDAVLVLATLLVGVSWLVVETAVRLCPWVRTVRS